MIFVILVAVISAIGWIVMVGYALGKARVDRKRIERIEREVGFGPPYFSELPKYQKWPKEHIW